MKNCKTKLIKTGQKDPTFMHLTLFFTFNHNKHKVLTLVFGKTDNIPHMQINN